MKLDKFINRPVLSTVISILIVILGILGLISLPVSQYPDIAPPTIHVSTSYTGANAQTVLNSVIAPLEEQINGVENMMYMTSTATNTGEAAIDVYFKQGTDPDMAAVNVQNRVAKAQGFLPVEVTKVGVITSKRQTSMLMGFSFYSSDDQYDIKFLENYVNINIIPEIKRIPGVGDATVLGTDYSMRIWLKPDVMAQYKLMPEDVTLALAEQNIEAAPGQFGERGDQSFQYVMKYKGRLQTTEEFENMVIRATPDGEILRLKDIANIELGRLSYGYSNEVNGHPGVTAIIYQTAGSNATEIINDISTYLDKIEKDLPSGVKVATLLNANDFLFASIHEVLKTLIEAFILVFLVVYVFLQDLRSTLIPAIAIPVALIGTFFVLYLIGFSVNLLTLCALVLAIAIVVDDAIVVVEGVHAKLDQGYKSARLASIDAMSELGGAIVSITLVMMAVFIPVSFMTGTSGTFYRQFGLTMAISIGLSAVNALTLSPAMCAILLRPARGDKNRFFRKINEWLAKGNHKYTGLVEKAARNSRRVLAGFGMVLVLIFVLNRVVPGSFIPEEDQGYFKVELELPEGATLERTRAVTDRAITYLQGHPAVDYVLNVTGSSPRVGTNQARSELTVILKPWEKRKGGRMGGEDVMTDVREEFYHYPEAKVYLSKPPVIPGLGTAGGFELQLEARGGASFEQLVTAVDTFMMYAGKEKALTGLSSSLQAEIPQLYFDVDRDKAKFLGIPMADIFSTMKAYTGSVYVNDFNMFNRIYRVYIQAEAPYRMHADDINLFFVRAASGEMVPLTALGTAEYTTGPGSMRRFNMFSTAVIRGNTAPGYSSGEAMRILEDVAKKYLPEEIGVEWSGLSYQEKKAEGQMGLIMLLVFVFVFLFLAALYESWLVPVAVLLSLPVAALGAYLGIWVFGLENDVYFQIGLVTLIGLAAKNAILIVEFAQVEVQRGVDALQAALTAASLRFRPILMTSLAFVLGMLPLVLASGPGSASRHSIGTGVFFGMLAAITVGIVMVPFFFYLINRAKEKMGRKIRRLGLKERCENKVKSWLKK